MQSLDRTGNAELADSRWSWLYRTSGAAAVLAGAAFLLAVIDLISRGPAAGTLRGWPGSFQDNWLAVIFKLHAGVPGIQIDKLDVFNFLDLGILALVATMYIGLYVALRKTSKIWSIIALVQPFLGIGLYVVTGSAGRSSVMGAGLVISAVMLHGRTFNKVIAWIGLLASGLLLAGDLSAGAIPPSALVAALFACGYVLMLAWMFAVAQGLFQIGGLNRRTPGRL